MSSPAVSRRGRRAGTGASLPLPSRWPGGCKSPFPVPGMRITDTRSRRLPRARCAPVADQTTPSPVASSTILNCRSRVAGACLEFGEFLRALRPARCSSSEDRPGLLKERSPFAHGSMPLRQRLEISAVSIRTRGGPHRVRWPLDPRRAPPHFSRKPTRRRAPDLDGGTGSASPGQIPRANRAERDRVAIPYARNAPAR